MARWFQLALKRAVDIAFSAIGLGLLALPFTLIALAIKLDSKGSVFFMQERIGRDGKPFRACKFRTMVVHQALGYQMTQDDPRITGVGRFLRAWGLDELPQLINVFLGEMSLVGPRALPYHAEQYDDFQRRRLEMKPGLTGLVVIRGRNLLSWDERMSLDIWYVEHFSIGLDLWILFKTPWVVLVTRQGVYGPEGINEEFVGSRARSTPGKEGSGDEP
jgi:lipopolysaccharide/colanic/teichoic acid biosynthesis glycosyltransferase